MKNIYKKIVAFQKEFRGVEKTRENEYLKSKYANLEDVMSAALPILEKHDLHVVQPLEVRDGIQVLKTIIFDGEEEFISEMNLDAMSAKADAQRVGSAVTYARRYSFCAALNIMTYDDDGNSATHDPDKPATEDQVNEIKGLIEQTGADPEKVYAYIKKSGWGDTLEGLNYKQAQTIIGILNGTKK